MQINEEKEVRIVEERGVAASPWKKEIDDIGMYIRKYVKYYLKFHRLGSKIEFFVPSKYTEVFNFLHNLTIHVTAELAVRNNLLGGGNYGPNDVEYQDFSLKNVFDKDTKFSFKRGKFYKTGEAYFSPFLKTLENEKIEIYCYYNGEGKVWLNSVLTSLYHELNHAYDSWIDICKTGNFSRYNNTSLQGHLGNDIENEGKYQYIGWCIYRLFSDTEYNALVSSVFGDLQGRGSTLATYSTDYKKTQAYTVYSDIKENIESEIERLTPEEAKSIWLRMKTVGISLNMKKNTVSSFKYAFLSKTNKKLNQLLHDIGRVASFYYDKSQEEKIKNNGKQVNIK